MPAVPAAPDAAGCLPDEDVAHAAVAPAPSRIRAALPRVDDFVAGHFRAAMEELARLLSGPVRGA